MNLAPAMRRCAQNPSWFNLEMLKEAEKKITESAELDRICFLEGSVPTSAPACFKHIRSLKVQSLSQGIKLGKLKFSSGTSIKKVFNTFFSDNYNKGSYSIQIAEF